MLCPTGGEGIAASGANVAAALAVGLAERSSNRSALPPGATRFASNILSLPVTITGRRLDSGAQLGAIVSVIWLRRDDGCEAGLNSINRNSPEQEFIATIQ